MTTNPNPNPNPNVGVAVGTNHQSPITAKYCKFQSAYRKGYSTETVLLRVVNDIQRAAGNGRCTAVLALDISAAFDAVDHATLIDRALNVFGIHDVALDWLRSFVTERTQQIAVGSEKSAVFECSSRVPQGSVLGPLLFWYVRVANW